MRRPSLAMEEKVTNSLGKEEIARMKNLCFYTTIDWFITIATFTAVAIEATVLYFHRRLER